MSLKGGIGMLGIDHQHGRFGSDESGADPGNSGGQWAGEGGAASADEVCDQSVYERLAGIPVAQVYRFRNSDAYRKRNTSYQPTRPTPIPIGERRKPRPQGRAGYLRIDTVHQSDRDGVKGIYHKCGRRSDAMGDRGGHSDN